MTCTAKLLPTVCLFAGLTGWAVVSADESMLKVPENIEYLLEDYCWKCHDYGTQKGDIRLDNLTELELGDRLELLNRMHEQTYLEHMPPKEEDDQPSSADRAELISWITGDLDQHGGSKLDAKLKMPAYGNYVSHEKLFSGEFADLKGYTPDRRWLISEYIFNAKFQRILENRAMLRRGKQRLEVVGSKEIRDVSLANPFLLPKTIGVRYYANEDLTGGHLSAMLTNAQKVSEYITDIHVPKRSGRYLPAIGEIMALEESHMATLASRREFLENFAARICEDVHGDAHQALLPAFVPVKLNPLKELEEGEKYKWAPRVAMGMLDKLEGSETVFRYLYDPEHAQKPDDEFRELCERTWFYKGDHERTIQARMGILREYLTEIREATEEKKRKIKPLSYEPLPDEEMEAIHSAIRKHRRKGDHYSTLVEKCMTEWEQTFEQERLEAGAPDDALLAKLVGQLSILVFEREATTEETTDYVALTKSYVDKLGRRKAIQKLIQTFILSSEFAYRNELGTGEPDEHGRRMLSPRDAGYAIAYALTDQSPDEELAAAAESGRLNTREDYKREVERILARRDVHTLIDPILEDKHYYDNSTNLPIRELRFFREFFGYPKALEIFKDEKRFGGDRLTNATSRVVNEADRLVEYILEKDRKVFEELLSTEEFYVYHDGDNERMQEASDRIKRIYAHFKDSGWENFKKEDLLDHYDFLKEVKMRGVDPDNLDATKRTGTTLQHFQRSIVTITARLDKGQKDAAPFDLYRGYGSDFMPGENVAKLWGYRKDNWHWSAVQPAKVPNRKGMLTHPAWLIAHAANTETDPVHRGKFVREKLLAGTIPDVPITVDAQIPDDHDKTLRARLVSATEQKACWHCHVEMNPLGYTFEMYDDFGRFRTEEPLEYPEHLIEKKPDQARDRNHLIDLRDIYKTLSVDATGHLVGTGDESLDGELDNAIDLTERLAKSRRVRQSIIRHAFRYFMGRNEMLSDSKTMIDAEKAYDESGGSFDAVIVSLLTSDSFIYRKATHLETDDR